MSDYRTSRRVALRYAARGVGDLLKEDLDPEQVEVYIRELVDGIDDLDKVEKELGIDLRNVTKFLKEFKHNDDLHHNGETVLEHIKWVLQDLRKLTKDKDQEVKKLLAVVAVLHDLGKAYTHEVTPEGRVKFYGHAEKSVEIADRLLAKVRKENADLAELIIGLVRHHDKFLALINVRRKEQVGGKTKYLNKFLRDALYTKGHIDKLLLFTRADSSRARSLDDTLSGIDDVLGDIRKVEQRAQDEAKAQERAQQSVQRNLPKLRALLEPEVPEAAAKLPNMSEVNRELGQRKRYDLLKEVKRIIGS